MPDPSERDQFHTAIYGHAPGTCDTCDTVRASGVLARNGQRPMVTGRFRSATVPVPDVRNITRSETP